MQKSTWKQENQPHLDERNVLWKLLLDILQPLERLSEGGEVCHHGSQLMLGNKPWKELPRRAAEQVELDV